MGTKRRVYRLRWQPKFGTWDLTLDRALEMCSGGTKKKAIKASASYVRTRTSWHSPSQLVVYNKNGRIAFERTYGADPRRHKG